MSSFRPCAFVVDRPQIQNAINMMARPACSSRNEDDLSTGDDAAKLKALRALKHTIIGSKAKKRELLHLLPRVLDCLASTNPELLVESAVTVGSFGYDTQEGLQAILQQVGAVAGGASPSMRAASLIPALLRVAGRRGATGARTGQHGRARGGGC